MDMAERFIGSRMGL